MGAKNNRINNSPAHQSYRITKTKLNVWDYLSTGRWSVDAVQVHTSDKSQLSSM